MNAYKSDILAQPAALQATLDLLDSTRFPEEFRRGVQNGRWRKIILTGMGSSYFVLLPLYYRLISAGLPAWLVETSELLYWPAFLTADTLVIAASQSGSSVETVRLLEEFGSQCSVIGVTNTADSPLGRRSSFAVLTRAGQEATVSCKTYLATLAAQTWLGDQLIHQGPHDYAGLSGAAPLVQAYLDRLPEHIATLKAVLEGVRQVYLTGRGVSIASAGTGGLILKESVHIAAEGMSSAAFRHGPFEMIGPETFVLVFAGCGETVRLNHKLHSDLVSAGGRAVLVGPASLGHPDVFALPPCPDPALQIMEILPVQMMTLALADLRNLQAGSFSRATKVTTIE